MSSISKKVTYGHGVLFLSFVVWAGSIACESSDNRTLEDFSSPNSSGNRDGDTDGDGNSSRNGASDTDADDDPKTNKDNTTKISDAEECAGVSEEAKTEIRPADIVLIVDNSPSMENEAQAVQRNMNRFSELIINSGIDAQIVLLSCPSPGCGVGICVDTPLGSGNCPNDTKLPKYKHVPQEVTSSNALVLVHSSYNRWKDMLRPNGQLHFVVVTDDDSREMTAVRFKNVMANVNPPQTDFIFHGITSSRTGMVGGCDFAIRGRVYEKLITETGGVISDLCKQDFDPVFDELANSVVQSSLSCEWKIPPPPEDESLDPEKVNVNFEDNDGKTHTIGHVDSKSDCENAEQAWYYDNNDTPKNILMCPQTCDWIRSELKSKVTITFGCETVDIVVF